MYVASNGIKTVVILPDNDASSPRDPDWQENITTMVCWHRKRNLGDKHDFSSPSEFAIEMASKHVNQKDIMKALVNGEFADFRVKQNNMDGSYGVEAKIGLIPGKEKWMDMDWAISKDTFEVIEGEATFDLEDDVLSICYADELLRVCEKCGDIAILPLYLYDHSGLAMSTGSFVGRAHHAEWDSSRVGYIYLDKETAMNDLAMEGDTLRVAMLYPYEMQNVINMKEGDFNSPIDSAMTAAGYSVVTTDSVRNLYGTCINCDANQPLLNPNPLENGLIFKKDRTLYEFDGWNEDGTFDIRSIASFNPDLKPLTEETWKARALEVLEADVKEYDNFLRGEIYGYQVFEGLDETDSCWGFNPGSEDIQDVIKTELGLGKDMDFEFDSDDDFDIEEYFENNDFPALREQITKEVVGQLYMDFQTKVPFPYAMSFADLRGNKDGILDDIVNSLYENHVLPDAKTVMEAIFEHAGVARDLQPKLSVADLDPDRDYTKDELIGILNQKPSLNDIIAGAAARQANQRSEHNAPERDSQR